MNALASLTMRTIVKMAIAAGIIAGVTVTIISHMNNTATMDRYDTVDAVVTSNPDITYRGRSGTAEVIATITYNEHEIRTAVPTQTQTGDTVTAYYDRDNGELWRATYEGQQPANSNALLDGAAMAIAATAAAGILIFALSLAAEIIVEKAEKRTTRNVPVS